MSLVQRSLSAGAVIALTALLRAACRGRLPRRTFVVLWDLAVLRLLLPLSLPWAYAPRALLRALLSHGPQQTAKVRQIAYTAAAVTAHTTVMDMPAQGAAALPWGSILWLTVMLLLAAHFLRAYVVSLRAFGEALPDNAPQTAAILCSVPLRRPVRVRVSGRIGAPLSYGVLRPVILLPRGMDRSGDTLDHVLLHELEHIRALDAARKLLLTDCVCVHWFNPLVWVMFLLANRDMELLCDARVLERLGRASRRDYAMTLLALEARRSGLSPLASSFSMTAIEERITAMKNMKKMSAASVLLAALLVLCAGAALATDAPKETFRMETTDGPGVAVEAGDGVSEIAFSKETYDASFAQYAPYGLTLDASGRLMYEGKRVRYFEDMYPVDLDSSAGTAVQFSDGEVDVYAVRDLTGPILRNPDGSFDPSGRLTGLRAATQEEFDARTQSMAENDGHAVTSQSSQAISQVTIEADAVAGERSPAYVYTVTDDGTAQAIELSTAPDIVWWTAEEYEAYVAQQREGMAQLVAEGASAWTNHDGWFVWTQEKMDEAMALYEQTLSEIRSGVRVSKTVNGSDDVVIHESPDGRQSLSLSLDETHTSVYIQTDGGEAGK